MKMPLSALTLARNSSLRMKSLRKLFHGVKLGDEPLLALGEVHGEDALPGRVPPCIAGLGLAVELLGDLADPGGLTVHLGAEAPAGEVSAVEQALETRLRLPVIGMDHGRERDRQKGDERKLRSHGRHPEDHGQGNRFVTIPREWSFKNGDPSMISTRSRRNKAVTGILRFLAARARGPDDTISSMTIRPSPFCRPQSGRAAALLRLRRYVMPSSNLPTNTARLLRVKPGISRFNDARSKFFAKAGNGGAKTCSPTLKER